MGVSAPSYLPSHQHARQAGQPIQLEDVDGVEDELRGVVQRHCSSQWVVMGVMGGVVMGYGWDGNGWGGNG